MEITLTGSLTPPVGRRSRARNRLLQAAAACSPLAGCASGGAQAPRVTAPPPRPFTSTPGAVPFTAEPGLDPAQRGARAEALLEDGQLGQARAEVDALLAQAPNDPLGRSLKRQMDEDPRRLLGGVAEPHKVQPGETLAGLAQRYLGDRHLFWALARYNGVAVPEAVKPGDILQIPRGQVRHTGHGGRSVEPRTERGSASRSVSAVGPAPAPPPTAAPAHDPARAARLRGEALEALSRGAAPRAVALLRQAAALDPDNPAVRRDLDRAERIAAHLGRR